MKKKTFIAYAILLALGGTFLSVGTADAVTTDELRAQIEALLVQVKQLQAQLAVLGGGTEQWCHNFNTNLRFGMVGEEVETLQIALQKENLMRGHEVRPETAIEQGNKSSVYFGEMTASAVVGFQQKYQSEILAPFSLQFGTGFVGPTTRAKLNALYGCGTTQLPTPLPIPTPIPVPVPSITVLSPNGGEKWIFGTPQTIKWVTSGIQSGKTFGLYLMATNQLACRIAIADALAGIYTITLEEGQPCSNPYFSNLTAGQYKILIDAASATGIENSGDESDNYFSIVASSTALNIPPVIQAMKVTMNASTTGELSASASDPDNDDLVWSVTWGDGTGESAPCVFASNPLVLPKQNRQGWTFTRSHTWLRPGVYTVTATALDCRGGSATHSLLVNVASDSVPSLTVLSPNGGEIWEVGKTYEIAWRSAGLDNFAVWLVDKEGRYHFLHLGKIISQSPFLWTVKGSGQNKILVTGSGGSVTAQDESDNYFSIISATSTPSFTVLSPNGGEQWIQGNSYPITWKSTGNLPTARISLYQSGSFKEILAAEVPNTGSWAWNIASSTAPSIQPGSAYSIRIFNLAYPNNWDDSDNYFSIVASSTQPL